MLPAGDFFQHQEPQLIAGIKKMRRLRIMRGADDIALELLLEDLSIAPLDARGHGLSYKGIGLMMVEAAKLDHLSIQLESMIGERGLAKTKAAPVFIEHRVPLLDAKDEAV